MSEKDEWNEIDVSENNENVEFEVEEEEVVQSNSEENVESQEPEPEPEPEVESKSEEAPQELEGIETKGAQKRIRQLVRQRKEREEQIQELLNQNQILQNELNTKSNQVNQISKSSLDTSEKQLTDKVQLARLAYMEAFEDGDKEKVLQAQEILNDAQADLKTISKQKFNYEQMEQPEQKRIEDFPQPAVPDPKARDWAQENEWFGEDNVMTAAALAIDAELKEQGYDPKDDEFYQEIDSRLQKTFPQKFGEVQERVQENTSKPAQVVSGSSRSSPSSGKKVKLSKEDVRLAQKWGIPLEQYAAEKLKVTQADGEYTTVN
jgi:hypothetical protein